MTVGRLMRSMLRSRADPSNWRCVGGNRVAISGPVLAGPLKSSGNTAMSKLHLTFACGLYDRMQPLYTGEVKPEGIDLNFIVIDQPRAIFDRMAGAEEFDVAEFSSSEFVQ